MQILIMFIVKKKIVQEDLALFNRNYLQPYRRAPNIQICRVQTWKDSVFKKYFSKPRFRVISIVWEDSWLYAFLYFLTSRMLGKKFKGTKESSTQTVRE